MAGKAHPLRPKLLVLVAFVCGLVALPIYFLWPPKQPPLLKISGVEMISLPGRPCGVVCSPDGNWVFVALNGIMAAPTSRPSDAVVVLHRSGDKFVVDHLVHVPFGPFGMVLTHDGKTLIATTDASVVLLDVARMISGASDPRITECSDGSDGPIYVNVTADDKILFVSNEGEGSISVFDLARARAHPRDKRLHMGKIPVGEDPIALTFSPDQRWLYTTSEVAPPEWGWPNTEKPERPSSSWQTVLKPQGAVVVVDAARARTDPAHAVVSRVPAGNNPVRMIVSPDGRTAYVTARASNAVLVFDAQKLVSDPTHSRLQSVSVGSEPVPLALVANGTILMVGNSNRNHMAGEVEDTLTLLEVRQDGTIGRMIGNIPAGGFPREICVSGDGQTIFISNFRSESLEVIHTRDLPRAVN